MLAYSPFLGRGAAEDDDDIFVFAEPSQSSSGFAGCPPRTPLTPGPAANDNIEARIDAVRPEDAEAVREGFWAKLAEARPHFGRLGKMRDLGKNLVLLFEMLVDPKFVLPWRTTAGIIFALAYFISSFDLIPDVVPVLGFLDDALVIAEVVYMFSADIRRYEETRRARAEHRSRRAA
jgi:uncharacterized membrane protein YkvA (DUF1232 family)